MPSSVVTPRNRKYWLASATSIALFGYLVEMWKIQRYRLPSQLDVVVDDRDEFCQIGSSGGNDASRKCYLARVEGLRRDGFVSALRYHCPRCLGELPGPRQGRRTYCADCAQPVEPLNVLQLVAGAVRSSGMVMGKRPAPGMTFPTQVVAGQPFAVISGDPAVEASELHEMPTVPLTPPNEPGSVATDHDELATAPVAGVLSGFGASSVPPARPGPDTRLWRFVKPRVVTSQGDLPVGWSLDPDGWPSDPHGIPHFPWDIDREIPEFYREFMVGRKAVPQVPEGFGLIHQLCDAAVDIRAAEINLQNDARAGGELGSVRNGFSPLWPYSAMLSTGGASSTWTPGLEHGRRTVAETATCSSHWAGTPTGASQTTPTVVDESVYGPRPFREYTEDELQFMRANGISPDFARVAQAVRDTPLQELVAAPQELRASEFLNPHDQTEMWIPLVNAVGLAETALNRRLVPVVEARFSYYHHAVLKPELAERGVLAHTAMLDAAFKHIHDGTAYVLGSVLKCPAARAVFADVVARYGIWSGRREYCIVLLGCIAYATALTTGDIIRWANGKEPFAPTGDASLVGIV